MTDLKSTAVFFGNPDIIAGMAYDGTRYKFDQGLTVDHMEGKGFLAWFVGPGVTNTHVGGSPADFFYHASLEAALEAAFRMLLSVSPDNVRVRRVPAGELRAGQVVYYFTRPKHEVTRVVKRSRLVDIYTKHNVAGIPQRKEPLTMTEDNTVCVLEVL